MPYNAGKGNSTFDISEWAFCFVTILHNLQKSIKMCPWNWLLQMEYEIYMPQFISSTSL